jgi:very-short-patch-repair endonuclease
MTRLHSREALKPLARQLRSEMTPAERRLWMHVRRKQILGVQFLRQRPIADYVVDFLAPTANLVVEVDGGQHYEDAHESRDFRRDRFLRDRGYQVLRFTNTQVLRQTDDVLEAIHQTLAEALKNPPQPPFSKGGSQSGEPT